MKPNRTIQKEESLNIQIQHRLIEKLTATNNELMTINSFAETIQDGKGTHEVLDSMVKKLNSLLGFTDCEIFLMDEAGEHLVQSVRFIDGHCQTEIDDPVIFKIGESLVGEVCVTGHARIVGDVSLESEESLSFLSEIAIPMTHDERKVMGVIHSRHPGKDFFQESHLKTLTTIASMAATKLIQTKNYERIAEYQTQLEEYVHIVSHDLKSPLRSINALVAWIKEDNIGKLDEKTLQNIDLINHTLQQMDNLITGTLNYSKLAYTEECMEEVDLNHIIQQIEGILYFPEHISMKLDSVLPTVIGDSTKFLQIFQNLIGNALKFINEPAGLITISHVEREEHYEFSITDNGIGIERKYFHKIFEVFQALSVSKDSSGVGLSIVKKLVNYYGGDIWLESTVGVGTTFYFTLKKD
ncbi:GAF domain-containing sensor histidine kinase [Marinoscillum sp.]|uniref:GAF domain-containing sensor histidine kinase n=1 Tax=Marinoscillum sp. TaxID=2024838 RepID=UPI003BAB6474